MKFSISCFLLILSSILLMSQNSYARKDSGDYWKSVMNDQPMPEAIKDLFVHQDHEHQEPSKEKSHFVGDFDMRPNAIIYHGAHHHQVPSTENRHFVRDFDMRPNVIIYHGVHHHHHQDQPAENKPFFKKASYIQTVNHG
ncbi:hypothetical protein PS2_003024 [Malus domestica]